MILEDIARALRARPRWTAWIALAAWVGFLFYMSSQSPPEPRPTSTILRAWYMNLRHAPAYGLLATLILWSLARRGEPWASDRLRIVWAVALTTLYGVSDEIHQSFVPGRDASVLDLITDLVGALFALHLLRAVEQSRPGRAYVPILAWGVPACLAAALLATFGSDSWPR